MVIIVNGTGVEYNKYEPTFKHLSSLGFIVARNDDPSTINGDSAIKTLEYILYLNSSNNNLFFNKIDLGKIGISGHSQGGCGVFRAITKFGNLSSYFKCAFSACAANIAPFSFEPELVNIPIMYVCSNGKVDQFLCPFHKVKENYDRIRENVIKVMGVRKNADHGEMLVAQDPYMTAWFCYMLLNDDIAGKAFVGKDCEFLKNNQNWEKCETKNL